MSDVWTILAGGVVGIFSAVVFHVCKVRYALAANASAFLAGVGGLLACGMILGVHFDHSPFTPRDTGQNTPLYMFVSWLGIFLPSAFLDLLKTQKIPKQKSNASSRFPKEPR